MKKLWGWWKIGFITFIPVILLFVIGSSLFNWLTATGSKLTFTESETLNIFFFFLLLASAPLIAGGLLNLRFVRTAGIAVLGKLPFVGSLFNFFFSHEHVERMRAGVLKEVLFQYTSHVWTVGGVVNEIELPQGGKEGPFVSWLLVIGPPTPPFGATAPLLLVRKEDVKYTGRSYDKTLVTAATFGFNFELGDLKKKKGGV